MRRDLGAFHALPDHGPQEPAAGRRDVSRVDAHDQLALQASPLLMNARDATRLRRLGKPSAQARRHCACARRRSKGWSRSWGLSSSAIVALPEGGLAGCREWKDDLLHG